MSAKNHILKKHADMLRQPLPHGEATIYSLCVHLAMVLSVCGVLRISSIAVMSDALCKCSFWTQSKELYNADDCNSHSLNRRGRMRNVASVAQGSGGA